MTKTRVSLHKKRAGMDNIPVISVSEIPVSDSSVKSENVTDIVKDGRARVQPMPADFFPSLTDTFASSGSSGMLPFYNSKCGKERHLLGVHGDVAAMPSSAVNCGSVGNSIRSFSGGTTGRLSSQVPVICSGSSDELVTQGPTVPLVTVASQVAGSVAPLMQMPFATEQSIPVDNAPQGGSAVQICIFSTQLANCAAESVHIGRYDNIIEFHQDYCTVPLSQNQRNTSCFIPANQSQINCYSEYKPSHRRNQSAAVQEPALGYAQTGVEQWVRQQNASRQKQEPVAASSVYASQMCRSCDQIPESGNCHCWPGHHKPMSAVDLARPIMLSAEYGNTDAAMNDHHGHHENCKIRDDDLTLEQRMQRQSKMGLLQVIQQMLTVEQQVPMGDECMDHIRGAGFLQSRVPPGISWKNMPSDNEMYAGPYNSGNHMVNTNYAPSAIRSDYYPPSWNMMTGAQRKWCHMQREHYVNKMGMQNNFDHCREPSDFCNSNVRYFGPPAASCSPGEHCQLPLRSRIMPAHAMCDYAPVYPSCDSQASTCESSMSSHMGMHRIWPGSVYGHTDIVMQSNYGCNQQRNRCSEFLSDNCVMPVCGSRQFAYNIPHKLQTYTMQSRNSGEDIGKQQIIAAHALQKVDVQGQQVTLTAQQSNFCGTDGNIVTEPMNTPASCPPTQMPTGSVRQRQSMCISSKKRQNNSSLTGRTTDSKLKKLDSGEWPVVLSTTRSGTLMNITSASLAHLAKGVENMSAVMQHTVQQGGPFRSVRRPHDYAGGSDENANFIPADNLLQSQVPSVLNPAEEEMTPASAGTSVTLPLATLQTTNSYSTCSVTTVTTLSNNVYTTGVDVVVTSKAPFTISYLPTGMLTEGDSEGSVDTRNASTSAFSDNGRMTQQTYVAAHMSDELGMLSDRSSEGFRQPSDQEQCGITFCKNPAAVAKADEQAAATSTQQLSWQVQLL